MLKKNNKLSKKIRKYLSWAEIEERELELLTKEDFKMRISKVVEKEWREEIIKNLY